LSQDRLQWDSQAHKKQEERQAHEEISSSRGEDAHNFALCCDPRHIKCVP
jgi:hypothetical protein